MKGQIAKYCFHTSVLQKSVYMKTIKRQHYIRPRPAHCLVLGKDSNVFEWRRMEVWVIISLLWALVTTTIPIRILARVDGAAVTKLIVCQDLISCE